jgi:hypothetical protein
MSRNQMCKNDQEECQNLFLMKVQVMEQLKEVIDRNVNNLSAVHLVDALYHFQFDIFRLISEQFGKNFDDVVNNFVELVKDKKKYFDLDQKTH